jgi:hypothetical protein
VNDSQCVLETTLEGNCTWIYEKNDSSSNGICVPKNTTLYECTDLNRTDQCEDGAGVKELEGKCGIYPNDNTGTCKLLCSVITAQTSCANTDGTNRGSDCFWLYQNTTDDPDFLAQCVNKVCGLLE